MELRMSMNEVGRISMLSSSLSLQSDEAHERLLVEVGCDILGGGESHHVDEVVDETDTSEGKLVLRQYVHAMRSLGL